MMADLNDIAYDVANQHRNGRWPELNDRDGKSVWAFLLGELKQRCPGFTDADYGRALGKGFFDSR
jgi:hypothetical protein